MLTFTVMDTGYTERVAAEVRAAAARRRMSGAQLADRLGMSQMAMSRRMSGRMPFRVDELAALAAVLEVDVRDLIPRVTDRYSAMVLAA